MHTILGAGWAVANALTRELESKNEKVTLVSRKSIIPTSKTTTWKKADLLNLNELREAVKGSTVIYLTAGLVYNKNVWAAQWPVIMENVITLAKETGARLIFFDNIYMYGLVNGPITEETPYKPNSVKGEIRAKIATRLMDEVKAGNIRASIARAADFYGTENRNSSFDMMVLDNLAKKQKVQWLGDPAKLHNYSYIPDMGKAMYLLGQNPDTDNQIWHMPTAKPRTGKQFIDLAAGIYGAEPKYFAINKFLLWCYGLINKTVMGAVEMYYQFNHDYNFDSTKFEKRFNFKPTSYEEGIREMSETLYAGK